MKFFIKREKVNDMWEVRVMKEIACIHFENEADSWAAITLVMHTLNDNEHNEVELYRESE